MALEAGTVGSRYTTMESGEQCVTMHSMKRMLKWLVVNSVLIIISWKVLFMGTFHDYWLWKLQLFAVTLENTIRTHKGAGTLRPRTVARESLQKTTYCRDFLPSQNY